MPPKQKQLRCAYVEGRQRCKRPGNGNPPLCEAHRIVIESEAARPQRPGEKLVGLLGRFMRGERVSDKHLHAGIEDVVEIFNSPDFEAVRRAAAERVGQWQGVHRGQIPKPPPRPRAPQKPSGPDPRVVLGFAAGQKLTQDDVKKRHRELARKHHPDRGGDVRKMAAINDAVDQLLASM